MDYDLLSLAKSTFWMIALAISATFMLAFSFGHGYDAAAREYPKSLQCGYAICVDLEKTGGQDQHPSSIFPIVIGIEPNHELRVKIFGPGYQKIYDKTFTSNDTGWVNAEYEIPANATEGYYRVYLSTKADEGKSYYSLLFTIGNLGSKPDEKRFHIGVAEATQNGEYSPTFKINKPVDVVFKFGNPYVNVTSGVPVNVALFNASDVMLENTTIYTDSDSHGLTSATYTFIPKAYGFYRTVAKVTYGGFSSDYAMGAKVRAGPEYAFEVEGKHSTVIIDRGGEIGSIKSVSLDSAAKKLDIEIAKEREYNILEIQIPYELLGDPYTVLTEGEPVNIGSTSLSGSISKEQTSAFIRVPVDESVSHVEIIGTSVIPEFGIWSAGIVVVVGIASSIVLIRNSVLCKK